MHEYPKFIKPKKGASEEGKSKLNSEEILTLNEAQGAIVRAVAQYKLKEQPYFGADGKLRMRIRDENKKIVYDNDLECYISLSNSAGIPIGIEEIKEFTAQAKRSLKH